MDCDSFYYNRNFKVPWKLSFSGYVEMKCVHSFEDSLHTLKYLEGTAKRNVKLVPGSFLSLLIAGLFYFL